MRTEIAAELARRYEQADELRAAVKDYTNACMRYGECSILTAGKTKRALDAARLCAATARVCATYYQRYDADQISTNAWDDAARAWDKRATSGVGS